MPSKPSILICGPSGSGKTSSLEQLFIKHGAMVAFLDYERKGLPFLYDTSLLAQYSEVSDHDQGLMAMTKAKANSKVKIIVYDSLAAFMSQLYIKVRIHNKGYDIFNAYADGVRAFFEFNKSTEKLWITTGIDEIVYIEQAEGSRLSRIRCSTIGKIWEGKLEREFLCVIYCTTKKGKDRVQHVFETQTDTVTSTKTPRWLNLPPEVPNDICPIVDKLIEAKLV